MKLNQILALGLAVILTAGCGKKSDTIKIGFSLDTLKGARWSRDRDYFVERCKELGIEVLVQNADSSDPLQISQIENLITQGIKTLVIVPHNAKVFAGVIEDAHKAGIKVISYDRMILDADVDAYVSFDSVRVGEMMAEALVKIKPKGNYVLMGGAPTDYNAVLVRQGHRKVIDPLVKKGDIKIVGDQWSADWLAVNALRNMENILTRNANKVDAVLDSYDGTAGGSIQALIGQKLAGKVLVSGQDAELAACQRIIAGTQTMTIYKPIKLLARQAAELAVAYAKGETIEPKARVNNGKKDVASWLLDPIPVDKSNMVETVIKDGFQKLEEVYAEVPKDQWPKP